MNNNNNNNNNNTDEYADEISIDNSDDSFDINNIKVTEKMLPINEEDKKCAAGLKYSERTCMTLDLLIELASAFNKTIRIEEINREKIKMSKRAEIADPKKYKIYLLDELYKRTKCDSNKCLLEHNFIKKMNKFLKEKLLRYTFRPKGPDKKYEWLSTEHIQNTLKQYEKQHENDPEKFVFLGAVPLDFNKIKKLGFANINFEEYMKENKTKFGAVFNLDTSDKSGSHWVALYADIKKCQIYFFDSYGHKPPEEIQDFMNKISDFCETTCNNKEQIDLEWNVKQHQFGNSECGMYSIYFIVMLLEGTPFKELCGTHISDEKVNTWRQKVFSNNVPNKVLECNNMSTMIEHNNNNNKTGGYYTLSKKFNLY